MVGGGEGMVSYHKVVCSGPPDSAVKPRLVWLGGLGVVPQTDRSAVGFLVRAHAGSVGQVPSWSPVSRNRLLFLSHIDVPLPPFFLPSPLSKI